MNETTEWEVYNLRNGWSLAGTVSGDEQEARIKGEELVGHKQFDLVPLLMEEVTS